MSFTFNWPRFSDQFHYDAIQMLNTALNKGNKPPIIADKIEVVELEMGTQPPELEIRDIGDLTMDQFRGIFRLTYAGDAHLVLKTKVQANPLNHKQPDIHLMTGSRGMLAAKQALVVPMLLRLSHFKLSSYVVLVVSKQKGITLVFKTDPLQSVDINSTFDSIEVIQKFIQREIEGQLRQMFREDLPGIIHRLSQQWVKVESPPGPVPPRRSATAPDIRGATSAPPSLTRHNVNMLNAAARPMPMPRTASISRRTSFTRKSTAPVPKPSPPPVNNDDEPVFDPTYGLRPEGLPARVFTRGFKSPFAPTRGLADLAETEQESVTDEDWDSESYEIPEWGEPTASGQYSSVAADDIEYDQMPAVGGGTILRPRVYHSQSYPQPQLPTPSSSRSPATPLTRPELSHNPFSAEFASMPSPISSRSTSPSPSHSRSLSTTPPSSTAPYHEHEPDHGPLPLTAHSIHALAMLSHSNHTLSPYTRSLAHFAVRSGPPRPRPPIVGAPVTARKGRRKRTYRIGGKKGGASVDSADPPHADADARPSEVSPSEFDDGDMDMYFPQMDPAEGGGLPPPPPTNTPRIRYQPSSMSLGPSASVSAR